MAKKLEKLHAKSQVICTSCGYCMPCPSGVNIPENFMLLNRAKLLGLEQFARSRFANLRKGKEGDKSALACKKCGACVPKCPNKVKIIQQLAETAKRLG
jgi:predicted aldo/keto reductase-like oxidoreductase